MNGAIVRLCKATVSLVLLFLLLHCATANGNDQARLVKAKCADPAYSVHLLSKDPLVIYLPNFLTAEEAAHVQTVTDGEFTKSQVNDKSGEKRNASTRTSKSTSIPRDDIVRCIEDRALAFQGFDTPRTHLEPLQLVQYDIGEKYDLHTDWFESELQTTTEYGGNRLTSFFVYVSASDDITGGGTNFPILDAPKDERWCKYINCDEPWEAGVTFRPIPGNAVFWQNLYPNGVGNRATFHAGLPITSGSKLGMNIWTRQGPLDPSLRGEGTS